MTYLIVSEKNKEIEVWIAILLPETETLYSVYSAARILCEFAQITVNVQNFPHLKWEIL